MCINLFFSQVFCWIDRWYGMTMDDIRALEDRVREELDRVSIVAWFRRNGSDVYGKVLLINKHCFAATEIGRSARNESRNRLKSQKIRTQRRNQIASVCMGVLLKSSISLSPWSISVFQKLYSSYFTCDLIYLQ